MDFPSYGTVALVAPLALLPGLKGVLSHISKAGRLHVAKAARTLLCIIRIMTNIDQMF